LVNSIPQRSAISAVQEPYVTSHVPP
jgi:hypothetical protein